jgi:cytidylate kinase
MAKIVNAPPRDASRYDLVINTSRIDVLTATEIIVTASRRRVGAPAAGRRA